MVSSTVLLFFLSAIFILTAQSVALPAFLNYSCIEEKVDNSANSIFDENLKEVLSPLSSPTTDIDNGFYHSDYGDDSDLASATGLCRGDVSLYVCRRCLDNAANLLVYLCPEQKEAIGWYDECMLRYSNRPILHSMETSPNFSIPNDVSADCVDQFNDDLRTLEESLRVEAAAGGPFRKFAVSKTKRNSQTLYALEQCTPDLSVQDCDKCLFGAFQGISQRCHGGKVFRPSCNIMFKVDPSPDGTIDESPGPPTDTNDHNRDHQIIFGLAGACAALTSMGIYIGVKGILRKNATSNESPSIELPPVSSDHIEANMPVQGGNGAVGEDNTPNRKDKLIKQIRMTFSSMYKSRKKKDESVVSTPINEEINEIQGQGLIPHGHKSDDVAVMPSSSTSQLEQRK